MGWATQRGPRPRLVATSHRLASCVIVSEFRAVLDLDTYPIRNLIRPWCAEWAKPMTTEAPGISIVIHYNKAHPIIQLTGLGGRYDVDIHQLSQHTEWVTLHLHTHTHTHTEYRHRCSWGVHVHICIYTAASFSIPVPH